MAASSAGIDGLLAALRDARCLAAVLDAALREAAPAGACSLHVPPVTRALEDVLDAFVGAAVDGETAAPPPSWGHKVGTSLFDEEEVLGRYDPRFDIIAEERLVWAEDIGSSDLGEEDGEEEEEGWASEWGAEEDDEDEEDELEAFLFGDRGLASQGISVYNSEVVGRSRMARIIQPLCCTYTLQSCAPEGCPICLEGLVAGERAWRLPCTHVMHEVCVLRFLRSRGAVGRCPLCRCDLKRMGVDTVAVCASDPAPNQGAAVTR